MHFINPQRICKGMEMGDIPSERSIVRDTITIAWPSVLESFFVCLAGMMDTIMVGSLGSYAIAAVGLSTQPKFLGLAIFLSMNVAVSAWWPAVGERGTGRGPTGWCAWPCWSPSCSPWW